MAASHRLRPFLQAVSLAAAVIRQHYFTLVSGAIIGGVLVLAMTSSSFGQSKRAAPAKPAPVARQAPSNRPLVTEQWLVYYLVADVQQHNLVIEAISSDAPAVFAAGTGPPMSFAFFIINDVQEEAYVGRLINNAAERAMSEGYNLKVVDMRP